MPWWGEGTKMMSRAQVPHVLASCPWGTQGIRGAGLAAMGPLHLLTTRARYLRRHASERALPPTGSRSTAGFTMSGRSACSTRRSQTCTVSPSRMPTRRSLQRCGNACQAESNMLANLLLSLSTGVLVARTLGEVGVMSRRLPQRTHAEQMWIH